MGFEQPTPIQVEAIPYLLEKGKKDFIGLAQTGTGKTAAFGLPLVELIDTNSTKVQALILSPTRELGQQTAQQMVEFSSSLKDLKVEVVYGGAAITNQIKALKKPTHIVVATPGRLLDLIRRRAISLADVKQVVLDEADEMLNMGFQEDIDQILANIQVEYSLWLFSATMPAGIRKIIKSYMKDPHEVSVKGKEETNVDISHQYIVTTNDHKIPALKRFLASGPNLKGILFCRTKWETQQIADQLNKEGFNVEALHGDLSQAQRDAAMNRFKAKKVQLLCATDVAARGLDVNDLTHVMHHKLPDQLEAYTHRSGRTGRAGKKGISIAFINNREGRKISELEKRLKITFEKKEVPSQQEVEGQRLQNWATDLLAIADNGDSYKLYQQIKDNFEEVSKEELITKLITRELGQFGKESSSNLNQELGASNRRDRDSRDSRDSRDGKEGRKGKREDRDRDSSRTSSKVKYELNIGHSDGINKRDLLQFIVDMSGINRKDVGDIYLDEHKAVFELNNKAKDFETNFSNVQLDDGKRLNLKQLESRNSKPRKEGGYSDRSRSSSDRSRTPSRSKGNSNPGMRRRRKS